MAENDARTVQSETWYECGMSAVVAENYGEGRIQFFLINYKGERLPFTNIKRLDEEGSVVTKDEAMAHLEAVKKSLVQ
jgi:hypothetical protein